LRIFAPSSDENRLWAAFLSQNAGIHTSNAVNAGAIIAIFNGLNPGHPTRRADARINDGMAFDGVH
jgi:hypothetical protein